MIAGGQGLASQGLDGSTVTAIGAAAGTATVEGSVWRHDTRDTDQGRSATEPGLAGMAVRLVDAHGATVATTTAMGKDDRGRTKRLREHHENGRGRVNDTIAAEAG